MSIAVCAEGCRFNETLTCKVLFLRGILLSGTTSGCNGSFLPGVQGGEKAWPLQRSVV